MLIKYGTKEDILEKLLINLWKMTKKLKIVLDTNAMISILSRRLNFTNILKALVNNKYELCITNGILLEYEEKIILKNNVN